MGRITFTRLYSSIVPLIRVGFMPLVPSPVTDYATERKGIHKMQSVWRQLDSSQSIIPVFCDEGFFHTVANIIIAEPNEF